MRLNTYFSNTASRQQRITASSLHSLLQGDNHGAFLFRHGSPPAYATG